jgi:hypothetical protein
MNQYLALFFVAVALLAMATVALWKVSIRGWLKMPSRTAFRLRCTASSYKR